MSLYQGRALRPERRERPKQSLPGRVLRVLGLALALLVVAHLPWDALRHRVAILTDIRVEGLHYLDAARICRVAGLARGADLIALDLARARQALLLDPRIAHADVARSGPRGVRVRIVEREPVLLVQHGVPWEVDSAGVLLAPLADGVVADVPLLAGPRFDALPAGTRLDTPEVQRGLAWVRAMSAEDLQLGGQISQLDVSHDDSTEVLLMSGTRVLTPAWPPPHHDLVALRVVLADLAHRGTLADEVDLRFHNQVIVRPVHAAPTAAHARPGTT
jgi:cell division septal protein FtsQ